MYYRFQSVLQDVIHSCGYEIADCIGLKYNIISLYSGIGLLYRGPECPNVGPGFIPALFIGVLWLDPASRFDAIGKMRLEVHGRHFFPHCLELAERISQTLGTSVRCVYFGPEIRFELPPGQADLE